MIFAVSCGLLVFAALHDLCFRTIPNWVPVGVLCFGAVLRFENDQLFWGLIATVSVFLLLFACWLRGWLGGGDLKLLSAATALVPPALAPHLILSVALAGGVLAFLYLGLRPAIPKRAVRRPGGSRLRRILRTEAWRIRRGGPLPYGVAILAGVLFTL